MPTTRPDTAFVDGVCSACINYVARANIDWAARKATLEGILEHGRNPSGFDCIVPSSGGKDSHAQVLTLIEMGAKPLVVTASTCYLTPIGRENIDNLARHATTIEVTPNRTVRKKLNKYGLETVGDISHPEHMAIFSIPFRIAAKFGIPLIFYGESPQREYGGPLGTEEAVTMSRRWISEFGGLLGLRAADCVGVDGINERDMHDYMLPADDMVGYEAYFLGQFLPWDSHANADKAIRGGMLASRPSAANWWAHENLDNAMTGLHDYMMYRKYGYGRACTQLSVDVRHGYYTREEGLKFLARHDGLFPIQYAGVPVEDVLAYIGISREQLNAAIDRFTDWSLFDRDTLALKEAA